MKVLVVLNERARDGGRSAIAKQIERTFFRHDVRVARPTSVADAARVLREATSGGGDTDLVVVAGGDGTVNLALQALRPEGGAIEVRAVPLGVIPTGTANDLGDELGLPRDISHACEVVKVRNTRAIDLVEVNGRVFATSGGTGLAADVAVDTNRFKALAAHVPGVRDLVKTMGKELYSLFLVKEFAFPAEHVRRLSLAWDGPEGEGGADVETALVMINNQPVVGGSFHIAPDTRNDDGTFCVSVFLDTDAASLARATAQVRSGRVPGASSLLQREVTRLRISARDGAPMRFFGDGELLADTTAPLDVRVLPQAQRLVVP